MRIRIGPTCTLTLSAAISLACASPLARAQTASAAAAPQAANAQDQELPQSGSPIEYPPAHKSLLARTLADAKAYYTAPLHWKARQWEYFGGALAAIAIAHHYDTQVRTHFDQGSASPLGPQESGELTDALPSAALFFGTWGYASLIGSRAGKSEAWNMFESAGLSLVSAYALKYVIRRPGPAQTTDPNRWSGGGSSFPSEHATLAFAIGTVLAESGNPEFRWIRRTIGYGIGVGTAYLRLRHNAHWLSDTVAGAALGMASAHFVMNRSEQREAGEDSQFSLEPVHNGVMLAYTVALPN